MKNSFWAFSALILLATLSRFLPHPHNFSPIAALALFGGAFVHQKRWAVVIPLLAMLISDFFLGLHSTMVFVYGAFALIAVVGWMLKTRWSVVRLAGASFAASVTFFVVSNFGVWLMTPMYQKNLAGLAQCFVAAVPFFHQTVMGDLFYSGLLFGGYWLAVKMSAGESSQAQAIN